MTLGAQFLAHPCTPADEGHEKGAIPAHLPGKNLFLNEPAENMHISLDAMRAGAASMYPEFRSRLEAK